MKAVYGGDVRNAGSVSPVVSHNVVEIYPTSVMLWSSKNPGLVSEVGTLSARVVGNGTPTGSITFKDGTKTLGTKAVVVDMITGSVASLSGSLGTVGSHNFTAVYSGDGLHAGSSSPIVIQQIVEKYSSVTVLSSSLSRAEPGQQITLSATVSSGGSPTGTVTFKDGARTLGTRSLIGGIATLSGSMEATLGTHNLTATYNPDAVHLASTSAPLGILIFNPTPTTVSWSVNSGNFPSPNTLVASQPVSYWVSVADQATGARPQFDGVSYGSVSFKIDGVIVASGIPVNSAGWSELIVLPAPAVGSHVVIAEYSGNVLMAGSVSPTATLTSLPRIGSAIDWVDAGISYPKPNPVVTGQTVTYRIKLTDNSGNPVLNDGQTYGTVTFKVDGAVIGSRRVEGFNRVTYAYVTVTAPSPGTHSVVAEYSGNGSMLSGVSSPVSFSVLPKVNSAVNWNDGVVTYKLYPSPNPVVTGGQVRYRVLVSDAQGGMLLGSEGNYGTVTFKVDGVVVASAVPVKKDAVFNSPLYADVTLPTPSVGTHTVMAEFSGNGSMNSAVSNAASLVIEPKRTSQLSWFDSFTTRLTYPMPNPATVQSTVEYRVVLTDTLGNSPLLDSETINGWGTVTFKVDGIPIATGVPVKQSVLFGSPPYAIVTLPAPAAGTHSVVAVYSGNTRMTSATSSSTTLTVTP